MTPRKEDRVIVHAQWSSFCGMRGTVKGVAPLMILIDGDKNPMRFGDREVTVEEPSSINLTGAE